MSYNSAYNDYMWNSIIDCTNFEKLFEIIYFYLRNQDIDIRNASSVNLTFRYELNGANATQYTINAFVLHESEIELFTSSGKLLIKT